MDADAVALRYPDVPDEFVFSLAIPNGYNGLSKENKVLYNSEKNIYNAQLKINKDERLLHQTKCDLAFSDLSDQFHIDCVARKRIYEMKKAALAQNPVPEPSATYRAILADIELKYAPNKPVDIESWQKKAKSINCRDGRGFQTNCNEFIEAIEELTALNAAPDRMMIQKWISEHFLKDAPSDFRSRLPGFGALNAADAVAGAVQPAVPRWRTFLNELASDISNFASWDYIKTNDQKAEGRVVSVNQSATTSYCYRCGKYGHNKKDCTSTRCVCGLYLNKVPNGHNTGDTSHDAKRVDYLKLYNERNKKSADRGGRPGGRGDDRRNPSGRGGRGRGATTVKGGSNSPQNPKPDAKDGKSESKPPSAAQVTALIETAAIQTEQMSKLLKSHEKLKVKLARTLDADDDAESQSQSDNDEGRNNKFSSTSMVVAKKRRRN
jgi:hypothetical protein